MLTFTISNEVEQLGVNGGYFVMRGMSGKRPKELEAFVAATVTRVKSECSAGAVAVDSVLEGFRELHRRVNCSNRKFVASSENLIESLFLNRFPRVNPIVDIYNSVSIENRLAIGAHDCRFVEGNIALRITNGTERFVPLGLKEPKPIRSGEYGYIDDSNDVICRLEVRQVEKTKVTETTEDCFFIVQGNPNTEGAYIRAGMQRLIDVLKEHVGGNEEVLYWPRE